LQNRDASVAGIPTLQRTSCDTLLRTNSFSHLQAITSPTDKPIRHLLDAIQYIQDGGVYISPIFRPDLMSRERLDPHDPQGSLSERERDVFYYLVEGLRAKEISSRLGISPKTVDTYRANVTRKLGIESVVGLVRFAIKRKLISE
jgi:DNA-binding NarL/FixJ family response regulator